MKRATPALLVAASGLILWYSLVFRTHFQLEDAFITFRYAANLVRGDGFVFNPGERVLGTTTPLQTLLLALFSLPFGPRSIHNVAAVIMPLFGIGAGIAAYAALTKRGMSLLGAALGITFFYANTAVIRTGIGGMETPMVLFLMALSLWALVSGRAALTGMFCGLLFLCRVDTLIWTGLLFAFNLMKPRRDLLPQSFAFAIVVLPWLIFATVYFGSPLPNSMLAKGVVRPGMENILLAPERMIMYLIWFLQGTGVKRNLAQLPLWLPLIALGARRILRTSPKDLGLLVIFPPVYALLMYVGRAPRYEWYLLPITFPSLLLAGVGVWELYAAIRRMSSPKLARLVPIAAAAIAVAGFGWYCAKGVPTITCHLRMAQENENGLRRELGLWLRETTSQDATVAMEAIGYQGYYSERKTIDMAGLVTPQSVEYKRRTQQNGEIFDWILRDFEPDYIVLRSFEVDENKHFNGGPLFLTSEKEQQFHQRYQEARRFRAPYWKSAPLVRHLTVYEKRNLNDKAPDP